MVFGTDTLTGEPVVVRRAPLDGPGGTAARDALRREARLRARLGRAGLAPRALGLIGHEGMLHLVRRHVPGRPLDGWVADRLRHDGDPGVCWAEAGPVALALLDLVDGARAEGLPPTGLTPGSVVVGPDGGVRLVHALACAEPGTLAARRARHGADGHALGGLLFLLATGRPAALAEGFPEARAGAPQAPPDLVRLGRWLALAGRQGESARRLAPAVLGLRAADPAERWTTARARSVLTTGC
ncbi:hypothetical protein GCM10025734_29310 [Kitasatospora paranensis]|uniref:hypothetical protein n=1 Tax=Kitasatospora paranensis TaxID=258053 RepID=UPI0031ED831F